MVLPILSFIVSLAGFTFTILIYRQRRTFENENHFFNYKLDQYGQIVAGASSLLELIYDRLHELLYEIEDGPVEETLDEISDEVEEMMQEFRVLLHKGCAFIPQNIIDGLDKLYDEIQSTQECIQSILPKKSDVEKAINKIDFIEDHLDAIINDMRTDMGIETIDMRLKKRAR